MNWNSGSMTCDNARAAIADRVIDRNALSDAQLDEHLTTCAACRAYLAECEAIWIALGELPVPQAARDARMQLDVAVRGQRGARWRTRALVAAGFIGAVLLGYGAASWSRGRTTTPVVAMVPDSVPRYLLLLYDTRASGFTHSPAQTAALISEYSAWGRSLRSAGKLVSADRLSDDVDQSFGGPLAANEDERLGGFFIIRAHDLAEAKRIAEGCPHLKHGGRIELRAIQPT